MSRKRNSKKPLKRKSTPNAHKASKAQNGSGGFPHGATGKASRPDALTILFSILAVVISVGSLANSIYGTYQNRKFRHAHISPEIRVLVRHSSRPEQAHNAKAPEVVIWNEGPIKVVSLSVNYKVVVIDPKNLTVSAVLGIADDLSEYNVLLPELAVGQKVGKEILGASPLAVFVVDTEYFRDTDLERFTRRDYFLFDSGRYFDFKAFRTHPNFEKLMESAMKAESKITAK